MTDITDPWAADATVMEMTDTDLQAARNESIGVTYEGDYVPRLVASLHRLQDLDISAICDRALRIELAAAIDNYDVTFSRGDYDVAMTLPQTGWTADNTPLTDAMVVGTADIEVPDVIYASTPTVVAEMATEAVAQEAYESKRSIIVAGLERQCGLLD